MVWGGLRGALGIALALGLPNDIPYHDQIVTVAFAVVGFSVLAGSNNRSNAIATRSNI